MNIKFFNRLLSLLIILTMFISVLAPAVGAENFEKFDLLSREIPLDTREAVNVIDTDDLSVTDEIYKDKQEQALFSLQTLQIKEEKAQESLNKLRNYFVYERQQLLHNNSSDFWVLAGLKGIGVDLKIGIAWQDNQFSPINSESVWQQIDVGTINLSKHYAGYILGSIALGNDPKLILANGRNLVEELVSRQQNNGIFQGDYYDHLWSVIALDSVDADYDREKALDHILSMQSDSGIFSGGLEGTGWSLIALAPYKNSTNVQEAINKTINTLQVQQRDDGDFSEDGALNLISVISGLVSVGEDVLSETWTKNNKTPLDSLVGKYQLPNGTFKHETSATSTSSIATEQGFIALADIVSGQSVWAQLRNIPTIPTKTVSLRVESYDRTIYPQRTLVVEDNDGDLTALEVLVQALAEVGINIEENGWGVSSIAGVGNGHLGGSMGWDGWNFLVNGRYTTEYGPGDWLIEDGDEIYFYYGAEKDLYEGWITLEELTHYPIISIEPAQPTAGQDIQVNIKAFYDYYDENMSLVTKDKETKIEGAVVRFNGREYKTNQDGIAFIPGAHVLEGTHTLHVSKDVEGSYPRLVRMERIINIDKANNPSTKTVSLRIESHDGAIYPTRQVVIQSSTGTPTVFDVITQTLSAEGISFDASSGYVTSIAEIIGGQLHKNGWDGWQFLVNGEQPGLAGPTQLEVEDGDEIYFYYGAPQDLTEELNTFDDATHVPIVSIHSEPKEGQDFGISITSKYNIYSQDFNLVEEDVVGKLSDVDVLFNGKYYKTNENGIVVIPGKDVTEGVHTVKLSKEVEGSYPRLVRTEFDISISKTPPSDGGGGLPPTEKKINLSVDKRAFGGYILRNHEVKLIEGDTPYSVLQRHAPNVRATGSGDSLYVTSIDGLSEFDHGEYSGWLFAVNGYYPDYGADTIQLKHGDHVDWKYTTNGGKDLGEVAAGGGGGAGQNEVIPETPASESGITVTIINQDKQMSKQEAERLREQLQKNLFTLQKAINADSGGILIDQLGETELIIPPSAIDTELVFEINKLGTHSFPEALSGVYEFLPAGVTFAKPVTISIKVPLLTNNLEDLALAWWDEKKNQWITVPAVVDAETGMVTGKVNHFTKFAVIDKRKLLVFETEAEWQKVLQQSLDMLLKKSELSEWEAYSLAKAGQDVPSSYLQSLEELLKENKAEFRKVTDLERIILTLSALGIDSQDFAGYNLIEKLYNHPNITMQGTNGVAFALIALDSKASHIPDGAMWDREKLVQWILAQQNEDGGFSLSKADGAKSDVDITAMVLQSLAVYQKRPDVQKAIEEALVWLSKKQLESGGFSNIDGVENSESVAQVIIALTSLDIDLADNRFVKSEGDVLSNLLSYVGEDGHFTHIRDQGKNDVATEQAVLALTAYKLWVEQELPLFNLRKVDVDVELPKREELLYSDEEEISFWAREAVKLAGEYGLMQGVNEDIPRFEPQRAITRAEFATLLDNLSGGTGKPSAALSFQDVTVQSWFYLPVARAVEKGWIKGVSPNIYDPNRAITREEMAVMVDRMLQLSQKDDKVFLPKDIADVSSWAIRPVAYVYTQELMVGDQGFFRPDGLVTREMAAVVMMRLYQQQ